MMREGLSCAPRKVICPFLQAAAAMVRVLKIRAAHSHLSMRASVFLLSIVVAHCKLNSAQGECLDGIADDRRLYFYYFSVLCTEFA